MFVTSELIHTRSLIAPLRIVIAVRSVFIPTDSCCDAVEAFCSYINSYVAVFRVIHPMLCDV